MDTTPARVTGALTSSTFSKPAKDRPEEFQLLSPLLSVVYETVHCVRKNHELGILVQSDDNPSHSGYVCPAYGDVRLMTIPPHGSVIG